jgi:hypothetical protein
MSKLHEIGLLVRKRKTSGTPKQLEAAKRTQARWNNATDENRGENYCCSRACSRVAQRKRRSIISRNSSLDDAKSGRWEQRAERGGSESDRTPIRSASTVPVHQLRDGTMPWPYAWRSPSHCICSSNPKLNLIKSNVLVPVVVAPSFRELFGVLRRFSIAWLN